MTAGQFSSAAALSAAKNLQFKMLPKTRRLPRPDFLRARNLGQTFRYPDFNVIHNSSPLPASRFAAVISSKISKQAVVRNRLKRQIYSAVDQLPLSGDFIIYPRASMLNLSREEINTRLRTALSKIS